MFKRRRKDAGAAATSETDAALAPPPATAPQPPQHRRAGSATTGVPKSNMPPPQNFDFDFLPSPPPFAQDPGRPHTSNGIGARKSSISFDPPVLPPIPRISSTRDGPSLLELMGADQEMDIPDPAQPAITQEPALAPETPKIETALAPPSGGAGSRLSPFSRPSLSPITSQKDYRESPWSSTEAIKMESSLFPTKPPVPQLSTEDEPMSREFIDSRDKPYAPAPRPRPALHTTNSSPDLRSAAKPTGTSPPAPSPLGTVSGPSNARPAPQQAHSTGNLMTLIRPPSNPATSYSGTTARSTRSSKSTAIGSDAPVLTVGTPYQETSQSYPLPQHVKTRPKTAGAMASIGGVNVPTHHTSALSPRTETPVKTEKRKTKLLNPMLLLSRRRAGQEDEALAGVRVSQAQALQRQRNVAAVANKIPEDFDPRIKGNVVHDFSAPRESRRMFSYNDALDPWGQMQRDSGIQSSSSAPFMSTANDDTSKPGSVTESSTRRSLHTPVFTEHLSDDVAAPTTAAAAIQAEKLENKAFLNRASLMSQESAVLPPFARRSQHVEPLQTSNITPGALPADQALATKTEQERDPRISTSSSGVSPITQRNSALPGAIDASQDGVSPISPSSSDKHGGGLSFSRQMSRPVSEVSRLGSSDGMRPHRISEVSRMGSSDELRPMSPGSGKPDRSASDAGKAAQNQPSIEPIAEEQTPKQEAGPFPIFEQRSLFQHNDSTERGGVGSGFEIPPRNSPAGGSTASSRNVPSTLPTPGEQEDDPLVSSTSPSNLVQKRADAVGHTNQSSSGAKPRHNVSNASRFSFQFGGSAAEELALEEKARKLGVESKAEVGGQNEDDDDDYFDEDAMNDMDEMEVEAEREDFVGGLQPPTTLAPNVSHDHVSPLTPTFNPMIGSNDEVQFDDGSDGISEPDSDEETPYWLHDALRSYTHTREPSTVSGYAAANSARVSRVSHGGAQTLTIDTNLASNNSGFYMHPGAAAQVPSTEQTSTSQRPPLPHRDSGNSERNRVASGLNFGAESATHKTTLSRSTVGSEGETTDRSFNDSSAGRSGSTEATGLGLSGFSGFKFIDTPDASRPSSTDIKQRFHSADRRRGDSETLPQDPTFASTGVARSSLDPPTSSPRQEYNEHQYDLDDMYFDDGGFDAVQGQAGDTVNEDAFDDDGFLDSTNRMARYDQSSRQMSDIGASYAAVVGDGPYPSFARPNSYKTRERDSQLLLEDLPLHGPVDPKLIPRRNPSEDAKRLGLSDRVPPLPAQGLNVDAAAKLQNKVHAYHAILAEAAQKAFEEGRFGDPNLLNVPSRSDSVREQSDPDKRSPRSWDDRISHYSRYDDNDDDDIPSLDGESTQSRKNSRLLAASADYSPARMSFDFGFDSVPMDDSVMDDGFGSDADDDIVAAANAEALANDDDGFYGQEFGFYAKARPNSSEVEAINGGFFGADGDDGLSRQRSMKEPNLTPITELSEFSRRTSFIGPGMGGQMGTPGIGPFSPFTPAGVRLPVSPWLDNEVHNLRKLKANAFGGSNASLHSSDGSSGGGMHINTGSAPASGRTSAAAQGYFGLLGSHPMTFAYSNDSSASSNPSSAQAQHGQQVHDSPQSATSGALLPSHDPEATPKRPVATDASVMTARKVADRVGKGHSRNSSGADSVTYVREQDPDGQRPPRWVLEKRRTSEAGQLELVAREVVQDGWI